MFVKTFSNKTIVFNVDPAELSVDHLKALIAEEEDIAELDQRLLFAGLQLEDGTLLTSYGVVEDSTIHLDLRLLGGGKKRKKKQYTGPKKQKHVKLAVLKLYKIDDNGKIHRQRLECNSASCGAGIFMAKHTDGRFYCGKCHQTLKEKK
uniref:Ubiquitin-like domain-containing protein n=1 Tax=Globodera pallida TaxID=36090 RepID=A0A183C2Q9_GLOPA